MAATETDFVIALTESAAEKFKELAAEEPVGEAEVLRIAIQGGGCSGFQYALGFDRGVQDGDYEIEVHGVRIVVDPFSTPYMKARRSTSSTRSGRGLRDRKPERRRLVRLRLVVPGEGRRRGRRGFTRRRMRLRLQPLTRILNSGIAPI